MRAREARWLSKLDLLPAPSEPLLLGKCERGGEELWGKEWVHRSHHLCLEIITSRISSQDLHHSHCEPFDVQYVIQLVGSSWKNSPHGLRGWDTQSSQLLSALLAPWKMSSLKKQQINAEIIVIFHGIHFHKMSKKYWCKRPDLQWETHRTLPILRLSALVTVKTCFQNLRCHVTVYR